MEVKEKQIVFIGERGIQCMEEVKVDQGAFG